MDKQFNFCHLYLMSYIILLLSSIIYASNLTHNIELFELGTFIGILLNVLIFMFHKGITNYLLITLILIIVSLISTFVHWKIIPLELISLFSILSNINLFNSKLFFHFDILVKILMLFVLILFNVFGIIPSVFSIGYSLGFQNPNGAGTLVLSIICTLILSISLSKEFNKLCFPIFIISIFLIILFYLLTRCRALILSGTFILICLVLRKSRILHYMVYKFSVIIGCLLSGISILISYWFNPLSKFWNHINMISSNRLAMQSFFIQARPLKLYGQSISRSALQGVYSLFNLPSLSELGSVSNFTIDNFYLSTAYFYGIIGIIIVIITFLIGMHISVKYKKYMPSVIMLSLLIYSCIESDTLLIYNMMPFIYIIYCKYNINNNYYHGYKINKSFNRR